METILIGFLGASTILPMNILMSCNQNQTEKFEEHWTRYTIYEGYNFVPTTNFVLERRIHSIYFVMEVVASNGKIYNYFKQCISSDTLLSKIDKNTMAYLLKKQEDKELSNTIINVHIDDGAQTIKLKNIIESEK